MTSRRITLRGGRRIRRWVFVLSGVLIALSIVALVGHRNLLVDLGGVIGLIAGVLVLWLGSSRPEA